jgi:LysR family glycine cleavage system transcriptional activator
VRLTGAGELLLQTTSETLDRLRAGLERIEPYRNKASLLLACPADFAHGWLMPRLAALRALHKGMEVWLMSEREMTDIDRIDVDLIVSRRPLQRSDLECVPLLSDAAIAVCGPQTARALAGRPWPGLLELAPLLFLEAEPDWAGLLQAAPLKGLKFRRGATVEDERLLLGAVEQELGVAWLSQVLAAQALAQQRVVRLGQAPQAPRAGLWLTRSQLTPRTPLVNKAFDWLRQQAAAAG